MHCSAVRKHSVGSIDRIPLGFLVSALLAPIRRSYIVSYLRRIQGAPLPAGPKAGGIYVAAGTFFGDDETGRRAKATGPLNGSMSHLIHSDGGRQGNVYGCAIGE